MVEPALDSCFTKCSGNPEEYPLSAPEPSLTPSLQADGQIGALVSGSRQGLLKSSLPE